MPSARSSTSCGRRRLNFEFRHASQAIFLQHRQDRLEEQRAILDTLVEANAEDQARVALDAPVLQATGQLLADTEVALQEAREDYERVAAAPAPAPISPEAAHATAPISPEAVQAPAAAPAPAPAPDAAAAGPPEATRSRSRSRSRERRDLPRRRG